MYILDSFCALEDLVKNLFDKHSNVAKIKKSQFIRYMYNSISLRIIYLHTIFIIKIAILQNGLESLQLFRDGDHFRIRELGL